MLAALATIYFIAGCILLARCIHHDLLNKNNLVAGVFGTIFLGPLFFIVPMFLIGAPIYLISLAIFTICKDLM